MSEVITRRVTSWRSLSWGAVGIVAVGVLTVCGPVARGATQAPHVASVATKAPASSPGEFVAVAAVPHSSDVWAILSLPTKSGTDRNVVVRRHHGHWKRVKTPGGGATFGTIVAPSSKLVLIGGSRPQAHTIQTFPAIWKWNGKKFVLAKLPKFYAGACAVGHLSASSTGDIWASGSIAPPDNDAIYLLHYTGKKWSFVGFPEPNDLPATTVSASSPTNAWATDGIDLFHWDGTAWTTDGSGSSLFAVVTSSPKLAYAFGYDSDTGRTQIMRFNGTTWKAAKLAKGAPKNTEVYSASMHGSSAWAVGSHETARGVAAPVILHSTGGAWKAQSPPGGAGFFLNAVAAQSAKAAIAVGTYRHGDGPAHVLVDVNSGRGWRLASTKF